MKDIKIAVLGSVDANKKDLVVKYVTDGLVNNFDSTSDCYRKHITILLTRSNNEMMKVPSNKSILTNDSSNRTKNLSSISKFFDSPKEDLTISNKGDLSRGYSN